MGTLGQHATWDLKLQYQMFTYSGFRHMFFIEQFHFLSGFGTGLFFLSTCLCLYLDLFSTNSNIFAHFRHLQNLSFLLVPNFWETVQHNSRYVQERVRVFVYQKKTLVYSSFKAPGRGGTEKAYKTQLAQPTPITRGIDSAS